MTGICGNISNIIVILILMEKAASAASSSMAYAIITNAVLQIFMYRKYI